MAAVESLTTVLAKGTVVLDLARAIQDEYRRYLNPRGQPGVGDLFYREVLNSAPGRIDRVELRKLASGDYEDFPNVGSLARFDLSDRKFAALSRRERIPVLTATDSDWMHHHEALTRNGVTIDFICGCDETSWFE